MVADTTYTTRLDKAALNDFGADLRGDLIVSGDDNHDAARKVWNGRIDRLLAIKDHYDPTTSGTTRI